MSRMPPPKKHKRYMLTPEADGDERTDRGNTIFSFYHSSNGEGIKTTMLLFKNNMSQIIKARL